MDEDIKLSTTDEEGAEMASHAKTKELRAALAKATSEKTEYLAGWQRAKADYINLKNTEEKARQDIVKYAKEGLIIDLLPLADSFDMAFANKVVWEQAPENWRKGIEYMYNQLMAILQDNGVETITPTIGDELDPRIHETLGTTLTEDPKHDGKVLEVIKKGYILQGKLIRPAQVKTGELK